MSMHSISTQQAEQNLRKFPLSALISKMNQMFDLPDLHYPILKLETEDDQQQAVLRLLKFFHTFRDEVDEVRDIIHKIEEGATELDVLTELADWLVDLCVYAISEALKYGIPFELIFLEVMNSQWSKLGPNGEVLKDENDKFLKGLNYQRPEPAIREILSKLINLRNLV